jgi:hypothetical protein
MTLRTLNATQHYSRVLGTRRLTQSVGFTAGHAGFRWNKRFEAVIG